MAYYVLFIIYLTTILAPYAFAQPKQDQEWQSGTIAGDALAVTCSLFALPTDLGRLLSEPSPITTDGELAHSLRSAHPIKVSMQPQSGTSDNLTNVTGCTIDGVMVMLSTTDSGDSITLVHTPGQIEFPDGANVTLNNPLQIQLLIRKAGKWVPWGGGSGGGSGGSVIAQDGQRVDLSGITYNSPTEGFFMPATNNCSLMIGDNQICLDKDDLTWYVGNGSSISAIGGGGGTGTGCTNLDDCANAGKTISSLDGEAGSLILMDSNNDGFRIFVGAQGPEIRCRLNINNVGGTETDCTPLEIQTFPWAAGSMGLDGAHCTRSFDVTLNALPVPVAVTCTDNNAATVYLKIPMVDRFDGTTLKITGFMHVADATPTGTYAWDWVGYCVEHSGNNGANSWPTVTGNSRMTFSMASGVAQHDEVQATTVGNVPLTGCTGANKKSIWLRGQVVAGSTTADDAGAGELLSEHFITGFSAEYGLKSFTD